MFMIKFDAHVSEKDLLKYNLRHVYRSMMGFPCIIAGILIAALLIIKFQEINAMAKGVYALVIFMFWFYAPLNAKLTAKRQAAQSVFQNALHFEFEEEGIKVSSPAAEEPAVLPWDYIYKIVTWKDYLLIYSNRVNAYIVPRADVAGCQNELLEFVRAHVKDYKLELKWK